MNDQTRIHILPTQTHHPEAMAALTVRVYGIPDDDDGGEWLRAAHFRHHLALFPEGQFVAVPESDPARVVGLTVSMRIDFDPAHPFIESWRETISNGWLRKHTPAGAWMYGVESCVDPAMQGRGIGGALMDARFAVCRALNLRGMVAGSTLMNYCDVPNVTPEAYLQGVIDGRYTDGNLTKQMKKGFRPMALIPDYVSDPCALGWGAVIVWDNPDYDAARGAQARLPEGWIAPERMLVPKG